MNNGCPVAPLDALQVYAQLGLISVGEVEASFVRCLVAFIDVQLPDDEALQQDNKHVHFGNARQALCGLLIAYTPAATGKPSRGVLALSRCLLTPRMMANGACCGMCLWKRIVVWKEARTS